MDEIEEEYNKENKKKDEEMNWNNLKSMIHAALRK